MPAQAGIHHFFLLAGKVVVETEDIPDFVAQFWRLTTSGVQPVRSPLRCRASGTSQFLSSCLKNR